MEYKIGANHDDPKDSIIEKRGHVIAFSINEVLENDRALEKLKKELNGQITIEDAKIANIEEHHPFIKDLTEEQIFTAHMYQEAVSTSRACKNKITEIDKQLEDDRVELLEISKQTGIELETPGPTPSPYPPVAPENGQENS